MLHQPASNLDHIRQQDNDDMVEPLDHAVPLGQAPHTILNSHRGHRPSDARIPRMLVTERVDEVEVTRKMARPLSLAVWLPQECPNELPLRATTCHLNDMMTMSFDQHIMMYEPPRGYTIPKANKYALLEEDLQVVASPVLASTETTRARKNAGNKRQGPGTMEPMDGVVYFSPWDPALVIVPHEDALLLSLKIARFQVCQELVDPSSSVDFLHISAFK
ncbi:hypothetical protein CK203_111367 [Vitis vinifera]|uniref:Uncharacterized protein n=1 Tax=Vitis vinifera TaxID=29760 RepID=A0A438ERZ7_VITVI|nr:hypothetical protein CK203_111367 [Vitis vinifera]